MKLGKGVNELSKAGGLKSIGGLKDKKRGRPTDELLDVCRRRQVNRVATAGDGPRWSESSVWRPGNLRIDVNYSLERAMKRGNNKNTNSIWKSQSAQFLKNFQSEHMNRIKKQLALLEVPKVKHPC